MTMTRMRKTKMKRLLMVLSRRKYMIIYAADDDGVEEENVNTLKEMRVCFLSHCYYSNL